jgi:peptidoglycan hydrolase CwlO-like protein
MLFAADGGGMELQQGITIYAIFGAALTSLFAYLTSRDKAKLDQARIELDKDKAKLALDLEVMKVRIDECEKDRADLRRVTDKQDAKIAALEALVERRMHIKPDANKEEL